MSLAEDLARAAGSAKSVEAFYGAALEYFCGMWAWPVGQAFHVRESPRGRVLVPARIWHADDRDRHRDIRTLTEEVTLTPDRGPAGVAVQTLRSIWVPDLQSAVATADDPRLSRDAGARLRGVLAIPVVCDRQARGILEFLDVRERPSDRRLLSSIRNLPIQLGWLLDRAGKTEETRRTRERMAELVEAVEAISAPGLSPEEVMQVTAERIQDLAGSTAAGVYEVSEENSDVLVMRGASGNAGPFRGTSFTMSETVTGYAFEQGEVILVNDVRTDPRVNREVIERTSGNANLRSFVAVPLIGNEGRPVALLNVMSNRTHTFTSDDVDLLRLLSRHMGSALDRARADEFSRKVVRDLTRTTEALRASLRRTEAIVDASLHPIVVLDPDNRVVQWSRAAERLYGWSQDEVIGQPIPVIPDDLVESATARFERVRGGVILHNVDGVHRTKEGARVEVRVSAAPITAEGVQSGIVLVITDMTEIRAVEVRLLHAERMESAGRLAGGVAHDFNNMLTTIRGHADLLLLADLDEQTRESVEEILKAVEHSSSIVQQLLDYSRKRESRATLVHPMDAISETSSLLSKLLDERIRLTVDLDPDAGPIRIDTTQLGQLAMNLMLNARDAMPSGGEIRISTSVSRPSTHALKLARSDGNRWVRLSVSDTGEGIPPELRARIFEPFFTTKSAADGIGLGLATVHAIVTHAGGTIELESEVGKGSTFHAYFPLIADDSPEDSPGRNDGKGEGGMVLLVEDAAPMERLVRRIMGDMGLEVESVPTQRAAIEHLAAGSEGPASEDSGAGPLLLITDITRGRLPLTTFLEQVRCHRPDLPVLVISDAASAPIQDSHTRSLAKPFSPGTLANSVEELLGSSPIHEGEGR